jgi:hypothetical protein
MELISIIRSIINFYNFFCKFRPLLTNNSKYLLQSENQTQFKKIIISENKNLFLTKCYVYNIIGKKITYFIILR